ncbi:balbiani ring protein 3-like [Rhopilema esculentum]|uniref:balbiani ring protein 3-like n=1 Tax=Rhopilema esculentum TaxID=499914 RepID=UPI0031D6CB7F
MEFHHYWLTVFFLYFIIEGESKTIPTNILEMLQGVEDFSSFVDIFQMKDQLTNFSVTNQRRRNNDVGVVAKLQNEKCKPRPVLVKVDQPNLATAFRYPFYVTLHRCMGSCGANPFLSRCAAAEIAPLHLRTAEVSWNSSNQIMKAPKVVLLPLQNETRCACECKNKMEACHQFQIWEENTCRCECTQFCPRNYIYSGGHECCSCPKKLRCPWKKAWNAKKCACECRKTKCKNPAKGRDPKTCKCTCNIKVCRYGIMDPKSCRCGRRNYTI